MIIELLFHPESRRKMFARLREARAASSEASSGKEWQLNVV